MPADAQARRKLMELIVYVLNQRQGDRSLTRTKLAKLLWYSDFGSFRERGEAITGYPYVKQKHGPMPASMVMLELDLSEGEGAIRMWKEGNARRYEALRPANLEEFSEEELEYVDSVLMLYRNAWASYLSHKSHEESVGWNAAKIDEEIPYAVDMLSNEPVSEQDERRGRAVAAALGLSVPDDDIAF